MSKTELNMLGNPCPIPVVKAKQELEKSETTQVSVKVDNIIAVQNLEKMATGLSYTFSYSELDDKNFEVIISKNLTENDNNDQNNSQPQCSEIININPQEAPTVFITQNKMGHGSDELGQILVKGFIFSLTQLEVIPKTVIFINSAVNLVIDGANTLEDLKALKQKGTKILVCGTCLNYYNLTERLAVGEITDMFNITNHLSSSIKLITI